MNALRQAQLFGRKLLDYLAERGELAGVLPDKPLQIRSAARAGGIGMNADSAQTVAVALGRPDLLRNPGNTAAHERDAREAVADVGQALRAEGPQSDPVKAM